MKRAPGMPAASYAENVQSVKRKHGISVPLEVERGGIIGVVDVIDCVESHKSKWFISGNFGWVLPESTSPKVSSL